MQMVKQDKFTKFYTIYLWTLLLILISIWVLGVTTMPNKVQAQETSTTNNCKLLEEENQRLRLEIENLKAEKFEATFSTCRNFCRRLQ
jgi:hypothetical protein